MCSLELELFRFYVQTSLESNHKPFCFLLNTSCFCESYAVLIEALVPFHIPISSFSGIDGTGAGLTSHLKKLGKYACLLFLDHSIFHFSTEFLASNSISSRNASIVSPLYFFPAHWIMCAHLNWIRKWKKGK